MQLYDTKITLYKEKNYIQIGSCFHDEIFVEMTDNATNAKNVRFSLPETKSSNGKIRYVRNVKITRFEIHVNAATEC